jgi:hypothetical protein
MAINRGDYILLGDFKVFYAYMSNGLNIIRKPSSLTGLRVARDPAFNGFRQSTNRMKEASPIASVLYSLIPKEQKVYALYRRLTGDALRMIKQGIDKEEIIATLKKQYINPLAEQVLPPIRQFEKALRLVDKGRPEPNPRMFSKHLFRVYPISNSGGPRFPIIFPKTRRRFHIPLSEIATALEKSGEYGPEKRDISREIFRVAK